MPGLTSTELTAKCAAVAKRVAVCLLLGLGLLAAALAQDQPAAAADSATLQGSVRDSLGHPVTGARVSVQNASGKEFGSVQTGLDGGYNLALPPGRFSLRVEMEGYEKALLGPFLFERSEVKKVDVALEARKAAASGKAASPQFFDEPQFTVAGVTDASSLGGHGSNAIAPTKRGLAKDVASLKDEPVAAGLRNETRSVVDAVLEGKDERAHARRMLESGELPSRDQAELHHVLAEFAEKQGNSLEAVREFQRAAEIDASERNLFDWGAELLLHHAAEPAAEVFTTGNRLFPRSARMLTGLGVSWYVRGSYELAAQRLGEASDLDPADAKPYLFLGKLQSVDTTHSDAFAERLARFAQLQPENALANYYYAVSLWKQRQGPEDNGHLAEIESRLEKAVRLDPKLGVGYLQLGILYADRGDPAKAMSAYREAIAASPDLSEAHYRLAQAYRLSGQREESQKELQVCDQLAKQSAAEAERERHEVQQFVYTLRDGKGLQK